MSVCFSTATATHYTTIATSTVLTSLSYSTSTLPAGTTTLTSSVCAPQPSGGTTVAISCRTFTTVSSLDGGTTTAQVPIAVTVTTTSVSPLSTLYSTTCSSTKTAGSQQTTAQTTVSTTTVSATTSSTTGHHRSSSAVTTVIQSSAAAAVGASSSNSDNTGVIVGAAVGGGIGLILVALLGWFLCHRRHRDKGDYIRRDKLHQGQFDGNRGAMVRPTPYPLAGPYRCDSEGSDYFSARPGRPRSYRKTVPAFDLDSPQAQTRTPSAACASPPPAAASRSGTQTASAGRPHARRVVSDSEDTSSPNLNPPQRGHRGEVVGLAAARSPPLPEKDRFYLHPDRGLTVIPRGEEEEGARSGPSAQGNAPSREDVLGSERERWQWQESRTRAGGETGVQEVMARRRERQQEIGGKRQVASTGIAREKRRVMDEHGGEESEGEAPPAYWE